MSVPAGLAEDDRDTDADWRRLGETDPYWAVLTETRFHGATLQAADREEFYSRGRHDVETFAELIARWTGVAPKGGRALDFGCGVGRLTEAMAERASEVTGYDISDAMVVEARTRSGGPTYTTFLPDGPFDWINSYIVFQHIPPERGLKLLTALLQRLAPGGAVSLQFTVEMTAVAPPLPPPPPRPSLIPAPLRRAWRWISWFVAVMIDPDTAPPRPRRGIDPRTNLPIGVRPLGHMTMYRYDLADLLRTFREHGVADVGLVATDHDHPGYIFVGRRKADASPVPQ